MTRVNFQDELQVQKLLAELTQGPVALSGVIESEVRRARLLPTLRAQVSEIPLRKSQRAARKRHTTWALAAAAVVVTGAGFGRWLNTPAATAQLLLQPRGSSVALVVNGKHQVLTQATSIDASGRLETTEDAALTTAEGVLVEMSAQTRVGLDELNAHSGWRLRLRQGHVTCDVPKLTGDKSFSVVTNDAEVIVHGTRFTVTSDDASTCVRVAEGRVEVRVKAGRTFLDPGQAWGCDHDASNDTSVPEPGHSAPASWKEPEAKPSVERKPALARPETRLTGSQNQSSASTLAQETELVGRALTAERNGQHAAARAIYNELLSRFPNSPMAPEARRGLKRVSESE